MTGTQRAILIVAAGFLLLFAFAGATGFGGSKAVASANFLAAVACLYLSARKSNPN